MTIFNVSSVAELNDALKNASGGDEIRLAGGDYGELTLKNEFSSELTITSADPADPAWFSSMQLKGAGNITFDGVNFDYSYSSGDSKTYAPFYISGGSHDITFRNGEISGDNDNTGYPTGHGLYIRGSSDITMENMEVLTWHRGFKLYDSQDITIVNSEVHNISGDGLQFNQIQGLLVEHNYFHDFNGDPNSATHRDMIQAFSAGSSEPSTNLTIRDNTFDVGDGAWTQTIFMRNEEAGKGGAGTEMYYQNIIIEGNIIYNAHTHGISVGETTGLVIRDNSIISVETNQDLTVNQGRTGGILTPTIGVAENSTLVTIENNVVGGIRTETQPGWSVDGNVFIQNTNPGASGYYDDVFIYYATGEANGYNQYGVRPGSIIDQANAGSGLVEAYPTPYGGGVLNETPTVDQDESGDTGGPKDGGDGIDNTDGGDAVDASDGSTDDSTDTGTEDNDGGDGVDDNSGNGTMQDAVNLLEAFDDFVLDISAGLNGNNQVSKVNGNAHVVFDGSNYAIAFDGAGDAVNLGRLEQFEKSEQIAFTVEFTRNEADGSHQRVVWNHEKIGLELVGDGLVVKVANNDADFHKGFKVSDIGLNDTEAHRITVLVNQDSDHLQVLVDDLLVLDERDTDFDFAGAGGREWGWMLGTPWGRDVDGTVTDFRIDDDVTFAENHVVVDDLGLVG